jgi:hypothetical protein
VKLRILRHLDPHLLRAVIMSLSSRDHLFIIMKIWAVIVDHKFVAHGSSFPVEVKSSELINDVKKNAKQKSPKALDRIYLSQLLVWKAKSS